MKSLVYSDGHIIGTSDQGKASIVVSSYTIAVGDIGILWGKRWADVFIINKLGLCCYFNAIRQMRLAYFQILQVLKVRDLFLLFNIRYP